MALQRKLTPYAIERVNRAISYLRMNYAQSISTDQLACEVGIDLKILQPAIKRITGYTIHRFQLKIRVEKALEILAEDFHAPVKCIASDLGFCSVSHFTSIFKAMTGMTPTEYRISLYPEDIFVEDESAIEN